MPLNGPLGEGSFRQSSWMTCLLGCKLGSRGLYGLPESGLGSGFGCVCFLGQPQERVADILSVTTDCIGAAI